MRLALWTPHPDAGWCSTLVPLLRREAEVALVSGDDPRAPASDLDLYHVADDPAHAFVQRALRARPGLVLLADWGLGRLAHASAGGDVRAYIAEARRAHGERGTFVARQVARGLAGDLLPTLLSLNARVLEASLGLVAFTEYVRVRAAARLPGRPVAHLPLDFIGTEEPLPDRAEARAALGIPDEATVALALSAESVRVLEGVPLPERVVVRCWPDQDREARAALAAADVAICLEFPPRGSLHPPLVRALAAGVPTLVSAGTAADAEIEDGVVVKVSPGASEAQEVAALLERLIGDPALCTRIGSLARAHVDLRRSPEPASALLLDLARDVIRTTPRAPATVGPEEGTLLAWGLDEACGEAREMGLVGPPIGLEPLLRPVLGGSR